jgi:hypothetical protein
MIDQTSSVKNDVQTPPSVSGTVQGRIPNHNRSTLEVKGSESPCCHFFTSLPHRFITFLKSIWHCFFPKKTPPTRQETVSSPAFNELEKALENKPQLKCAVSKTQHTLIVTAEYGDKSTQIELKKITKTIEATGFFKKDIEYWLLEKFDVGQFPKEVQEQITLNVRNGIEESGTRYLQYASSLKNFKSSLFLPYFKPSGYPSILVLKPNES